MRFARKLRLARRLRKAGFRWSYKIVDEADKANIPVSTAVAIVHQETGWPPRNIFGCDTGARSTVPFCHQRVTKERVQALVRHTKAGGTSNGVGLTQLTWPPFIYQAQDLGGAHRVRPQLRVGFGIVRDLLDDFGQDGLWRYNGAPEYQAQLMDKKRHAIAVLYPHKRG